MGVSVTDSELKKSYISLNLLGSLSVKVGVFVRKVFLLLAWVSL